MIKVIKEFLKIDDGQEIRQIQSLNVYNPEEMKMFLKKCIRKTIDHKQLRSRIKFLFDSFEKSQKNVLKMANYTQDLIQQQQQELDSIKTSIAVGIQILNDHLIKTIASLMQLKVTLKVQVQKLKNSVKILERPLQVKEEQLENIFEEQSDTTSFPEDLLANKMDQLSYQIKNLEQIRRNSIIRNENEFFMKDAQIHSLIMALHPTAMTKAENLHAMQARSVSLYQSIMNRIKLDSEEHCQRFSL